MAHEVRLHYYAIERGAVRATAKPAWHIKAEGCVYTHFGSNALSRPWDIIRIHLHQRLRQRRTGIQPQCSVAAVLGTSSQRDFLKVFFAVP